MGFDCVRHCTIVIAKRVKVVLVAAHPLDVWGYGRWNSCEPEAGAHMLTACPGRNRNFRNTKGRQSALCFGAQGLVVAGLAVVTVEALGFGVGFSHAFTNLCLAVVLGAFAMVGL